MEGFPPYNDGKYRKIQLFSLESLGEHIWPCHKIGQGHPRVIIYIIFEELGPQVLHTKFLGNQAKYLNQSKSPSDVEYPKMLMYWDT